MFVILIALDQLGLGEIMRQTFLILVGGRGLGLALAFGLGGRERAAELSSAGRDRARTRKSR